MPKQKSLHRGLVWFDFCFTALQHILGHFGRGQLTYPHCSWVSFLGNLPVLNAHSFASNWQLLFLNQRKRDNGRRNVFMTKSPRKNVPDVGIELGATCMPSEHASDRATAPGLHRGNTAFGMWSKTKYIWIGLQTH